MTDSEFSDSDSSISMDRPVKGGRVTLKMLAQHLGLSVGAVSVVLNDRPEAQSLRQETRERIRQAARDLGYRPNRVARSLRQQRSNLIGVLVPHPLSPYGNGVVAGLEEFLLAKGYLPLTASHHSDPELMAKHVENLSAQQVDGLVLVGAPDSPSSDGNLPVPSVRVAGRHPTLSAPDVAIDHDHAAVQALTYLKGHGHRRIAFIKGFSDNPDTFDRWRAMVSGMEALGLDMDPDLVMEMASRDGSRHAAIDVDYEQGYLLGQRLVKQGAGFTALFAFNDLCGAGAMRALLDAGLKVPEEVSVVGFDDIYSARFFRPSLTTLRQPLEAMGVQAGELMLQRLATPTSSVISSAGSVSSPPTTHLMRAELVVRESTGKVASGS